IAAHEGVVNVRAHDTRPLTLSKMRQPYTLTLEPELVERLKAWIARQDFPPAQNAVVARAIEKYLEENGG
ncbi:hypothetical protein, partial [Pseudohoeflea coraliihabitans]